jgi:hypothetical protein
MRPEYMRTDNVGFQRRIPVISRLPLGLVTALPVGLTPTARAVLAGADPRSGVIRRSSQMSTAWRDDHCRSLRMGSEHWTVY